MKPSQRTLAVVLALAIGGCDRDPGPLGPSALSPGTVLISDELAGSWTPVAPMPTARFGLAAATGRDGTIYAIGGSTGIPVTTSVSTVEAYQPRTDSWTVVASIPTARRFLMAATDRFGRIYAIGGGSAAGFRNTVERYDPAAGTWTAVAPLPAPLCCGGAATGLDGRVYVFGGFNALGQFQSVEAYDPTTDTWQSVAALPAALAGKPGAAAALNGSIYLMGGITDVTTIGSVRRYDVVNGTWSSVASMPTARRFLDAVTGRGGQIYALGGTTGSVGFPGTAELALVERYDPRSDTWVTATPMGTPRGALAAAVDNSGIIFAIGGFDGISALSSVEAFTPGPVDVATGGPGGLAGAGGGSALR